jgi:hypothetical protein
MERNISNLVANYQQFQQVRKTCKNYVYITIPRIKKTNQQTSDIGKAESAPTTAASLSSAEDSTTRETDAAGVGSVPPGVGLSVWAVAYP